MEGGGWGGGFYFVKRTVSQYRYVVCSSNREERGVHGYQYGYYAYALW